MAAAKKFKVTPSELPSIKQHLEEQLQAVEDAQDIAKLEKTVASSEKEFLMRAQTLSVSRRKAAHQLQEEVTAAMQELSMAGGKFTIELIPLIEGASHGLENVEFHVAAHPGVSPKPLSKVASGGELARISLAISVITSKANATPTLIFDEVDSGIGGAVADTVGKRLKELGLTNQVLCVTHLPQVAAQANHHWKVSKSSSASQTLSTIQALNRNERVEEVARMLGGSEITDITRRHARELLGA
jgi:DNA repair protein RecN (Recombination protein N)